LLKIIPDVPPSINDITNIFRYIKYSVALCPMVKRSLAKRVHNQLNTLEPVGNEISIVEPIKYDLLSNSMPIVNI
jgi:hypothetical protein